MNKKKVFLNIAFTVRMIILFLTKSILTENKNAFLQ